MKCKNDTMSEIKQIKNIFQALKVLERKSTDFGDTKFRSQVTVLQAFHKIREKHRTHLCKQVTAGENLGAPSA